jgi:3-hydroxyisobutyrate dehydrogenase
MGRHMAASLQRAGHDLQVHDVSRDAADALVAGGAQRAESPAHAASGAEVVFTCLPGPAEVEAVALGGGLLATMRVGGAWFDLTTNSPDMVRQLAAMFSKRHVHMLDAPVSGGPKGAESGRLALWVGGDAAIFERYLPLLKAMGDEPLYIGPVGAGSVAKLAHNCANFGVQLLLAEVFTLGVKAGVEPSMLFQALRQGTTGRSRTFDRLSEQFLRASYDPPAFALRLAHKDMTLVMALARACDVPMHFAELAMQQMSDAMLRGWGERDARIALSLQEERAGVSVRIPAERLREIMESKA